MNDERFQQLHIDLGFAFSLYVANHVEWALLDRIPQGANIVFQTDDPKFSAWELGDSCQRFDGSSEYPVAVIQIHGAVEPVSSIDWENAELLVKATA